MDNLKLLLDGYKESGDKKFLDDLIREYDPYIINIVSETKGEYVRVENDEEYSVALEAFAEAADRYDEKKGKFTTYAALVIKSRIKSYWKSRKNENHINIDDIDDIALRNESFEDELVLKDEIQRFEKALKKAGLSFESLADTAPKHVDTRERAVRIALEACEDAELMEHLSEKNRIPITRMAEKSFVSPKVIKGSKEYITAIMIACKLGLKDIINWIKNSQKGT